MRITIIGCGAMGSSLAKGLSSHHTLFLYDGSKQKTNELAEIVHGKACQTMTEAVHNAEIIIIAIKPFHLDPLVEELSPLLNSNQILISVLTGTTHSTLKKKFPKTTNVRMMPNLAVQCEKGVMGFVESPEISESLKIKLNDAFQHLGFIYWLKESRINALTALTGSGPAFIMPLIESIVEAGIAMGFHASDAYQLALKMMEGSLALLESSKEKHPGALKWQISSPGGTTIAGLRVLEREKIKSGLMETFLASFERAQQMSS